MKMLLILLTLLTSSVYAQDKSVAMISTTSGNVLSTGSCVIVDREFDSDGGYIGLALTAYHITEGVANANFRITYFNGRSCSTSRLVATDKDSDLAVVRTWVPLEVPPAPLATQDGAGEVEIIGYPQRKLDRMTGMKLRTIESWHMSDIEVRPGFSGGGTFRNQQLVGIISGGWFWLKDGQGRQATWPTRSGGLDAIKSVLAKAKAVR